MVFSIEVVATTIAATQAATMGLANLKASHPTYVPYPKGSFPDIKTCQKDNWNLGTDYNPYAPPKPWPVKGQQVYIKDEYNFCINLPDPNSSYLKKAYYDQGFNPTIVQAEGFVHAFCLGSYKTPGASSMPSGAITAAHVIKNFAGSVHYYQITGRMDCKKLGINCDGSYKGAYDDGGQYDSVSYRNCGKEPYSGVDSSKNPGLPNYVEQAGDGIFCMRICNGGLGEGQPCNVKHDEDGCYVTMGMVDKPGFSYKEITKGGKRRRTLGTGRGTEE
ncbi:hypothetical protein HK101_008009 [Irineochytrium annulatum]|nr:hypothetical protein HK101_008009 [Irineochytrium annulatum]